MFGGEGVPEPEKQTRKNDGENDRADHPQKPCGRKRRGEVRKTPCFAAAEICEIHARYCLCGEVVRSEEEIREPAVEEFEDAPHEIRIVGEPCAFPAYDVCGAEASRGDACNEAEREGRGREVQRKGRLLHERGLEHAKLLTDVEFDRGGRTAFRCLAEDLRLQTLPAKRQAVADPLQKKRAQTAEEARLREAADKEPDVDQNVPENDAEGREREEIDEASVRRPLVGGSARGEGCENDARGDVRKGLCRKRRLRNSGEERPALG